jgi:hypothetical protein
MKTLSGNDLPRPLEIFYARQQKVRNQDVGSDLTQSAAATADY